MADEQKKPVYAYQDWEIDLARRELRLRGAPVPLGARAFEIIELLVQAGGGTVNKYDLMGRIWPGAVVEENTLQFHISAVRKSLGRDRGMLKTAFGRGYRLLGEWAIREESAALRAEQWQTAKQPLLNNLPAAVVQLIGRATAMKEVQDALSAYRIVTLTGPGGVGKTALALEVARSLLPDFQGDAVLVELASLSDPDLVPSAMATNLGLLLGTDHISPRSVAQLIAGKKLLLVLDNCEHLIGAAAGLTETIVRMCPAACVLVTSREPLRIEGERVHPVPPLNVPPADGNSSDALQHSAVQLFMARTMHNSNFSPQKENLAAIAAICRDLDGIPLAIEFAAARAVTLGVQHVAARLNDRFRLLAGARRTALPRHQTLRATLDWSYELLSDREKYLLRHLAVFPGGFTIEAAAAMADGGESNAEIEERISGLVWKSLVTLVGSASDPRWRLLETTRAYALEKLTENGEAEQAARRQAEFLRDLFAPAAGAPLAIIDDFPRYVREIDNVRTALDWAFSPGADKALGIALTAAYAPVWSRLSLMAECRERAERALDSLKPDMTLDARFVLQLNITLGQALNMDRRSAPSEKTDMVLANALKSAERLDDIDAQLQALWITEVYRFNNGDLRHALIAAERFLEVARRVGDPFDIGGGHRLIGGVMHYAGDQRAARSHLERAVELNIGLSAQRHMMWSHYDQHVIALSRLARVLWLQGLMVQADKAARTALAEAQIGDHRLSICFALAEAVCPISMMSGDLHGAEQSLEMLMELVTRYDFAFWKGIGSCLEGKLLIARGEIAAGCSLLRSALGKLTSAELWLYYPGFAADFAESLAAVVGPADGIAAVNSALSQTNVKGIAWYNAELLRIKGELLALDETRKDKTSAAEDCFRRSLELAREQGALFWELRAALSLARLLLRQDRPDDARKILAPVHDRFTEGYDTADLRAAKIMLELPSLAAKRLRRTSNAQSI